MKTGGDAPIGIFDSGIGGLTVARAVRDRLPGESITYFGDTARVPYGPKSPPTILNFARQNTRFLLSREVKLIVVACNTVSAVALPQLQQEFDIPFIGVIEPGARAAAAVSRSGSIGVIGTRATIASGTYSQAIMRLRGDARVIEVASPLLVPLVEEGWLDHRVTRTVLREYLSQINAPDIDTLVLGCTHYPLLVPAIGKLLSPRVAVVDSARETAAEVAAHLQKTGTAAAGGKPTHSFFVSDIPLRFEETGRRFFGGDLARVEQVDIEGY